MYLYRLLLLQLDDMMIRLESEMAIAKFMQTGADAVAEHNDEQGRSYRGSSTRHQNWRKSVRWRKQGGKTTRCPRALISLSLSLSLPARQVMVSLR